MTVRDVIKYEKIMDSTTVIIKETGYGYVLAKDNWYSDGVLKYYKEEITGFAYDCVLNSCVIYLKEE